MTETSPLSMAGERRLGLSGLMSIWPWRARTRGQAILAAPEDIQAVALLVSGEREARDRSRTLRILRRVVAGKPRSILKLPPHSVSMRDARAGDHDLMERVQAALGRSRKPGIVSRLASLYAQMRRWDDALALLDQLETTAKATLIDRLLAFQIARIDGRRERLETFDPSSLEPLVNAFPEVRADVVARHLTLGEPGRFARDIRHLPGREAEGEMLSVLSRALASMPAGSEDGAYVSSSHAERDDWERILAVCSLRCSGGAAIQDFIEDHPSVRTSAGEYVALSGYMGLRTAWMAERPRIRAIEFVRQHLLGLTVPISRSHSRILRQARADRAAGQIPATLAAISNALSRETTVRGFLDRLLLNVWGSYLDAEPGSRLLLKKLFTQGRLEMFAELPPFRCVMVWRDPRDQYADQVNRGFCRAGDVEGFITRLEERVASLRKGLSMAGPKHRDLFLNVGFEAFVSDAAYRESVRSKLGLDATNYAPRLFLPEASQANIGIWRTMCDPADIAVIETRLADWLDTAAIRLDNEGL